jgi:conjugative element/phage-associated large polyvalent protein
MTEPHTTYLTCAQTAKLLRQALKEAFPTTKFSVRSDSYVGGASIDVHLTDGPPSKGVQVLCNRFEGTDLIGCKTSRPPRSMWSRGNASTTERMVSLRIAPSRLRFSRREHVPAACRLAATCRSSLSRALGLLFRSTIRQQKRCYAEPGRPAHWRRESHESGAVPQFDRQHNLPRLRAS